MLLNISGLSRSTYYYHFNKKDVDKYEHEKEAILKIFKDNKGRYGYRRILFELRDYGYTINHKTVLKLMQELGIKGKMRRSKYKSYKGELGKVAPNIMNRNFVASQPFEKLATDVTEFNINDTKVYLSPIMDLYNREIISYNISTTPSFYQTIDMLNGLFDKLPKTSVPILHSDQGWQYQMKEYQRLLKQHNIIQSMSRKGNCLDNSPMENFFGRLKVEMFFGEKFGSVDEFINRLKEYIDYHNNTRKSLVLKGMSPVQYRTHSPI